MLGIQNIPTTIAIITIHLNRIAIRSLDLLGSWHCWDDCVKMNLWLWTCPKSTIYRSGCSTPFWQTHNSKKANCFLVSDDLHRCCHSYNAMSQPQVVNRTEFYRCSSQISVLTLGFRKIIHAVGPKVPPKKEPIGESIAVAGIKGISCLSDVCLALSTQERISWILFRMYNADWIWQCCIGFVPCGLSLALILTVAFARR